MNKYDVLGVVGEGAYGVVLKCRNKDTGEVVAIKKFKESEEDEVVRKTTLREVKLLRIMRHENIVQLKEAFRRKGKLYLVFEFVEKSMLDILEAHPNGVDTDTVRVLTCQLSRAIDYCHQHDVIHRDVKPENLLINPVDNALRLCDFGFARFMSGNPDSPLTDYVATRWYRAPELLLGSTKYGKDVDIWALGCIMGELTDGQPLFAGESEVDQLFVIQKVLGPLTPEHMEMFLRNDRFLGIQFPDVSRPETLEKRYVRRMPKLQMQLLKSVLVMHPPRRLSIRNVLRMPWFEGVKLPRSLRPPSHSQPSQTKMRPESSSSVAATQLERSSSSAAPSRAQDVSMMSSSVQDQTMDHSEIRSVQREDQRAAREDSRMVRDDPRGAREDQRATRDDSRILRDEPRGPREDARAGDLRVLREDLQDGRPHWEEPRQTRDDLRGLAFEEVRPPREDPRTMADPRLVRDERRLSCEMLPPHLMNSHAMHHHSSHSHPYVLPWEDSMPGPRDTQQRAEFGAAPSPYGETDDKGPPEGRRSRQRRAGTSENISGTGDTCERLPGDRGTPKGSRGTTSSTSNMMNPVGVGPSSNFGGGMMAGGCSGGCSGSAVRHGVSAGTGGSEEWPSTQARGVRNLREPELEDDKATWPKRKLGRQPAALGFPGAQPARRTPELVDPWQQDHRSEAWRASEDGTAVPVEGGSRAPSRLTVCTPTPRDEEALDFETRKFSRNTPHESRTPQHETRGGLGSLAAGGLGGLGRWPDLPNVYHGL